MIIVCTSKLIRLMSVFFTGTRRLNTLLNADVRKQWKMPKVGVLFKSRNGQNDRGMKIFSLKL